jgi:hypothetical protein
MKLHSFGADPVRDAEFRAAALQLAAEIRDTIFGIANSKEAMKTIAMNGRTMKRFEINLERLGVRRTEFILLLEKPGYTGSEAAYFSAVNMVISLKLLPTNAEEVASSRQGRKILQKYLIDRFHRDRDIIVHEIIHMIDYLRGNPLFLKEQRYMKAPAEQRQVLYINNPLEFNALFQQAVVQIQDAIAKGNSRKILSSFDNFMAVANKVSTIKQMRASILPEWERRLDVRLWQTWQNMREAE